MEYIFDILERIKKNYGLYIGNKSICRLATFLSGYECALRRVNENKCHFNLLFQLYVQLKLGIEQNSWHWKDLFLQKYSDEEAYEVFFKYLEEFKELYIEGREREINLFIYSPIYYTSKHGVEEEIYKMCWRISQQIDVRNYTECLDYISIYPILAPCNALRANGIEEKKNVCFDYNTATISIISDYECFKRGDIGRKKEIILENILQSLKIIKNEVIERYDYEEMARDIIKAAK